MKRVINNLFPFAAMAFMCLVSCAKVPVEPTPEPGNVDLSLVVDDDNISVLQGTKIPFKIETTNPPQSNLTITIVSGDTKIISVPPTLVLGEGQTEVSSEAIAVSKGVTTISLAAIPSIDISNPSVRITVR